MNLNFFSQKIISMQTAYLLPFSSMDALRLELSGGKGANLARLSQAGLPVPAGIIISTAAYRAFVQANHLTQVLADALAATADTPLQYLEEISAGIRRQFAAAALPPDLEMERWVL